LIRSVKEWLMGTLNYSPGETYIPVAGDHVGLIAIRFRLTLFVGNPDGKIAYTPP